MRLSTSATRNPNHLRIGVLVVALVVLLSTGSVGAQARLLSSTHMDGDSIGTIDAVRFEFDSLLIADASAAITLTRTNGQSIPVVGLEVDGTIIEARIEQEVPSGTYELAYSVRSADGQLNEDSFRLTIDAPSQELSGGLLAVLGIFFAMFGLMFYVFYSDKRRRPGGRRGQVSTTNS